jgi:hypothetical protein
MRRHMHAHAHVIAQRGSIFKNAVGRPAQLHALRDASKHGQLTSRTGEAQGAALCRRSFIYNSQTSRRAVLAYRFADSATNEIGGWVVVARKNWHPRHFLQALFQTFGSLFAGFLLARYVFQQRSSSCGAARSC